MQKHQDHQELALGYYGLTEADLDVPVSGHGVYGVPSITTAREIIARLRKYTVFALALSS